ncbi:melanopsin-A isoform X3 [Synchiropus splendidus]|uniref:melanopsin-A isoform X3 n=1 Tax=Synchiropus splendidus TaxID=270530 RepID=UPI00237D540A|nr:melanopsin-A isoform X3 [Synchiropus splendidus]
MIPVHFFIAFVVCVSGSREDRPAGRLSVPRLACSGSDVAGEPLPHRGRAGPRPLHHRLLHPGHRHHRHRRQLLGHLRFPSRSLRTPANMFIVNLAIADLLMCVTQTPVFFISSMRKRWIFGERACELYAFCGALFGICSMITLMIIAVDRYFVITRPLTSIGVLSYKRAFVVVMVAWAYSLGWSLPPFFGWSAYVPEGLMTSCTWDYMTFTPSVRAYTTLLFTFVFFLPLAVIIYCYVFIFRAVRSTNQTMQKLSISSRESGRTLTRLQNEWKMAKVALLVILLYVVSWAPYSSVALTALAGYADMLTPYMNSVPAVIAKASAIHNPIIYAITHPKYRLALARYVPGLAALLCVRPHDLRSGSSSSSFVSTRRSTLTSQTSEVSGPLRGRSLSKPRLSSASDSESGWTDTEAELSSLGSRPASRQVSSELSRDTAQGVRASSVRCKMKSLDSGVFEKQSSYDTDVSMVTVSERGAGAADVDSADVTRAVICRIPSIVVTQTSPFLPIGPRGSSLKHGAAGSSGGASGTTAAGPGR